MTKTTGKACTILRLREDEFTCSLLRLHNFGESTEDAPPSPPVAYNYGDFLKALRKSVTDFNCRWYSANEYAIIQAEVLSTQPRAQRFLRRIGFQEIRCDHYLKYPDHGISLFVMPVSDFLEKIKTTTKASRKAPPAGE